MRRAGPGGLPAGHAESRSADGTRWGHEFRHATLRRSAEATVPRGGPPGPARRRCADESLIRPLLNGVAAAGEAGAEGAVVFLKLRLDLLLLFHLRVLLLFHLPPRADGVHEPSDTHAARRAGRRVSRHRPARSAHRRAAGRATAAAALLSGCGWLGSGHRDGIHARLLHRPVVALLLVARHLL